MLTPESADRFARSWCDAWNAHDLDAIMRHYARDIVHTSPLIARVYPNQTPRELAGGAAVREYFRHALDKNPGLAFDLKHVAVGRESLVVIYTRAAHRVADNEPSIAPLAAEVLILDNDHRITRSMSHYTP